MPTHLLDVVQTSPASQALWSRIHQKAVFSVQFETDELIEKCIAALDAELKVAPLLNVPLDHLQPLAQCSLCEADAPGGLSEGCTGARAPDGHRAAPQYRGEEPLWRNRRFRARSMGPRPYDARRGSPSTAVSSMRATRHSALKPYI